MPARALLETATGNNDAPVISGVDRMRATARIFASAQARECRLVDHQLAVLAIGRQNALLAVAEPALRYAQGTFLETDARAVAVLDGEIGENDSVDAGTSSAQDQRSLAFAGHAAQQRATRLCSAKMHNAFALHRAFAPVARGDDHSSLAAADGIDRGLQRRIAAARFGNGEAGRRWALRQHGGERDRAYRHSRDGGQEPAWHARGGRGVG